MNILNFNLIHVLSFYPFFYLFLLDNCTEKYVCYRWLIAHQRLVHSPTVSSNGFFVCPYCYTQRPFKSAEIERHFIQCHSNLHLEMFQCLFCQLGFTSIDLIREHMFELHPSKFLFIGTRRNSSNKCDENNEKEDQIRFVYIGDAKDYSTYKLLTCANHGALDDIDPEELHPHNLYKIKTMQNSKYPNITAEFTGSLPAIRFKFTASFTFVTLEQFIAETSKSNSPQHASASNSSKGNKTVVKPDEPSNKSKNSEITKSTQRSQPKISHNRLECQNNPMVVIPKPNQCSPVAVQSSVKFTPEPLPSTSKQCQNDHKVKKATVAVTTPKAQTVPKTSPSHSIQYVCITKQIYDDLSNPMQFNSRICCMCFKYRKIENQTHFQQYLLHLINNHACAHKESMTDAKAMFDHRMQHHRNDPIMALQMVKPIDENPENQWLVHKIVRARYRCTCCSKCFDSHREIDSHNSQKHRNLFRSIEIVFETMIIKSDDPQQPVKDRAEFTPLLLYTLFKCERCRVNIGRKSSAIEHHNECHPKEKFEVSIKKFVFDSENPPKKYWDTDADTAEHREYLYQCTYCKLHFDSYKTFEAHKCDEHSRVPQFQIHKLVKCSGDKIIGTFSHMKSRHAKKRVSGKPFTPVSAFCLNECALCNYKFSDDDELCTHYNSNHSNITCDLVTNSLLDSLNSKNVDVGECNYTPSCCPEMKRKKLDQIVHHASVCMRRFACNECPMHRSKDLTSFIKHGQELHGKTAQQCMNKLHNFKYFQDLLSDMYVVFPIGLYANIENISGTDFENKLRLKIREKIFAIIEKERIFFSIG